MTEPAVSRVLPGMSVAVSRARRTASGVEESLNRMQAILTLEDETASPVAIRTFAESAHAVAIFSDRPAPDPDQLEAEASALVDLGGADAVPDDAAIVAAPRSPLITLVPAGIGAVAAVLGAGLVSPIAPVLVLALLGVVAVAGQAITERQP